MRRAWLTGLCGVICGCIYVPNPDKMTGDELGEDESTSATTDASATMGGETIDTGTLDTDDTDNTGGPNCGNGVIDVGEACDGGDVGGLACSDFESTTMEPFTGGELACNANCMIVLSGCSLCGDGVITGDEVCDGGALAGETCTTQGFDAGTLACANDCGSYDVDACTECGDGVVEGAEECDGNNLDGQTCSQLGFMGGTLSCAECMINTSQCSDDCDAPNAYAKCDGTPGALTNDPWKAIGVNCPGDLTNTVVASDTVMNSNNANAWRVASQFGSANGQNPNYAVPNLNGKMWAPNPGTWTNPDMEVVPSNTSNAILILSTGVVAATNAQSVVLEANAQTGNGDNGNVDAGGLPAPLSSLRGSNFGMGGTPFVNCDQVNDCSESLYQWWNVNLWNNPDDKLWMQAELTIPPGTEGFVFDFAFFSSEFPTYYDTQFNDQFIVWSTSETYTGNLVFVNGAPLTLTSLEDAGAFAYKNNAPELAQTGFSANAGTGWFVVRGPVDANNEGSFQLTFFISDLGDSILATGVLLDNFRWECSGCIPSEVASCGIQPP